MYLHPKTLTAPPVDADVQVVPDIHASPSYRAVSSVRQVNEQRVHSEERTAVLELTIEEVHDIVVAYEAVARQESLPHQEADAPKIRGELNAVAAAPDLSPADVYDDGVRLSWSRRDATPAVRNYYRRHALLLSL